MQGELRRTIRYSASDLLGLLKLPADDINQSNAEELAELVAVMLWKAHPESCQTLNFSVVHLQDSEGNNVGLLEVCCEQCETFTADPA